MGVWVDLFILPSEDRSPLTGRGFISLVSDLVTENLVEAPCAALAGDVRPSPLAMAEVALKLQSSSDGIQRLYHGPDTSLLLKKLNQAGEQNLCVWFAGLNERHNDVSQWLDSLGYANGDVLLFAFNKPQPITVESLKRCSEEPPLYGRQSPSAAQVELLRRLAAGEDVDESDLHAVEGAEGVVELALTHIFAMTGKGIPDSVRFCHPLRQLFLKHFGSPFLEGLFFS